MPDSTVVRAIDAIADGHMVLAVDAKDREDEAYLVIAAEFATPKALTCMAHKGFDTRSSGATKAYVHRRPKNLSAARPLNR